MNCKYLILLASMGFAAFLSGPSPASAQVSLGDAADFAVLAGTKATCTNSNVTGDVGVVAGTVVQTGCSIDGTVHQGDPAAADAYGDFLLAYTDLADETCTGSLNTVYGVETLTLTPGVYCNAAAVTFTGTTLRLNAQGNPNAVWIFKIGTGGTGALTTTGLSVDMIGGGQPCNVYWRVAQAATLTTSNFQGTILAGADITVTGTVSNGAALAGGAGSTSAPTGAVTLTGAIVSVCGSGGGCKVKVIFDCDDDDGDHDDDGGGDKKCKKHGKKHDKKHHKKHDR